MLCMIFLFFFFQAEDGIRDLVRSRGLGDVYKRQVRIEVRRAAQIKQGEKIIGNRVKVKIVKNKVAAPFRTCEFDIMYNEGISVAGDLVDLGVEHDVVKKSGNSYSFKEVKLGLGREAAKKTLKGDKKLLEEVKKAIIGEIKKKETEELEK